MNWFQKIELILSKRASEAVSFTPRAREAILLGRDEALRLRRNYVGTEHVLLGLIKLRKGVAINVLEKMALNLENVQAEIEKLAGIGPDEKMFDDIPYTPRMKRVVQLARDEAKALSGSHIGTGHILIALLRGGEGLAAKALQKFKVNIEEVRKRILEEPDPTIEGDQKGDR